MENAVFYGKHITYREYEPNIDKQFELCKEYASKKDLNIIKSFSDVLENKLDECFGFNEMQKYCKETNCKYVIIFSATVLGRILERNRKIIKDLQRQNIEVKIADCSDWLESLFKEMI